MNIFTLSNLWIALVILVGAAVVSCVPMGITAAVSKGTNRKKRMIKVFSFSIGLLYGLGLIGFVFFQIATMNG